MGVGLAGVALWFPRPPIPRPAQAPPAVVSPSPTLPPPAAKVDLEPEAASLRARVLQALPAGARWQAEGAQAREDGALRWRHARYRVVLPAGANVKAATGAVVRAAEDAGGVLLASQPRGRGQVLEVGLDYRGKALPVLQVQLVPQEEGSAVAHVAVVLDDAGMQLEELERALRVGRPVAVAVIPGLPYSEELARRAQQAGLEVLVHLPMEPEDRSLAATLGEPAVRVDMSDEEVARAVRAALRAVPGAVGVNNHMGSRATADPRVMKAVLQVVREEGLFFLDSRTTRHSTVEAVGKQLGVRILRRTVFLDNDPTPEAVRARILELGDHARRLGSAVGIGHIHRPHTPEVLASAVEELERAGLRLVPVSQLAR